MSREYSIILTVSFAVLLLFYLTIPIYVVLRKKQHAYAYNHMGWYMFVLLGSLLLSFENALTEVLGHVDTSSWPKALLIVTWFPYQFGIPLAHLPLLVRGWRIVCVYSTTMDVHLYPLKIAKASPFARRARGDGWLMKRVIILLLPICVTYALLFVSFQVDWATVAYTALTVFLLLLVVGRMVTFLPEMKPKLSMETKWMVFMSFVFLCYYVWQNISFYILQKAGMNDMANMVEMVLVTILFFLVECMWLTTPGETSLYKSVRRTHSGPFATGYASRGGRSIDSASVTTSLSSSTTTSLSASTCLSSEDTPIKRSRKTSISSKHIELPLIDEIVVVVSA